MNRRKPPRERTWIWSHASALAPAQPVKPSQRSITCFESCPFYAKKNLCSPQESIIIQCARKHAGSGHHPSTPARQAILVKVLPIRSGNDFGPCMEGYAHSDLPMTTLPHTVIPCPGSPQQGTETSLAPTALAVHTVTRDPTSHVLLMWAWTRRRAPLLVPPSPPPLSLTFPHLYTCTPLEDIHDWLSYLWNGHDSFPGSPTR